MQSKYIIIYRETLKVENRIYRWWQKYQIPHGLTLLDNHLLELLFPLTTDSLCSAPKIQKINFFDCETTPHTNRSRSVNSKIHYIILLPAAWMKTLTLRRHTMQFTNSSLVLPNFHLRDSKTFCLTKVKIAYLLWNFTGALPKFKKYKKFLVTVILQKTNLFTFRKG